MEIEKATEVLVHLAPFFKWHAIDLPWQTIVYDYLLPGLT